MNLGTTRSIVWTMPPDEDATEVKEYRFTFGSCNMAGSGRYFACMRDFGDWYQEQNGASFDDALKSKDISIRSEAIRLQSLANGYGAIMASLKRIEERTRLLDEKQPVADWVQIETPSDWNAFASFYDAVPWAAAQPLADAANACNPGLWSFVDSDTAKKNGGVNVG
jgi:hypothetical protein